MKKQGTYRTTGKTGVHSTMKKSEYDYKTMSGIEYVGGNVPQAPSLTHDQLLKALYYVFDFMDRAMINFYLVGSTGESVKNHKDLFGSCISIAVRKNEWESGARRIADAFAAPIKETKDLVEYEYDGVPIKLYVLPDSELLRSPDTILYASEYFKLPNPYEEFKKEFTWLK